MTEQDLQDLQARENAAWEEYSSVNQACDERLKVFLDKWNSLNNELIAAKQDAEFEAEVQRRLAEMGGK